MASVIQNFQHTRCQELSHICTQTADKPSNVKEHTSNETNVQAVSIPAPSCSTIPTVEGVWASDDGHEASCLSQ